MNEIEREFNMEVKQKKSTARGAYHKKGGSKSKKCSLPSDHLTPAQKRKLNGPVLSYSIVQPMSWEEFKEMPIDLQQAHLDYIQNRFSAGLCNIEDVVFGRGQGTLRLHCRTRGLHWRTFKPCSCDRDGLYKWAYGETSDPETEPEPAEVPELSKETVSSDGVMATETEEEKTKFSGLEALPELFGNGKLCMSGKANEVIPRLLTLIGSNEAWLSVHLSFTRKDERDWTKNS